MPHPLSKPNACADHFTYLPLLRFTRASVFVGRFNQPDSGRSSLHTQHLESLQRLFRWRSRSLPGPHLCTPRPLSSGPAVLLCAVGGRVGGLTAGCSPNKVGSARIIWASILLPRPLQPADRWPSLCWGTLLFAPRAMSRSSPPRCCTPPLKVSLPASAQSARPNCWPD